MKKVYYRSIYTALSVSPHTSTRLAEQVKWCRFINTQGLPGHNISCDLDLEHLNRVAKIAIDGLGSNKTDKAIQRIGRAVGTVMDTLINFDSINEVCHESGAHSTRSNKPDLKKVINELKILVSSLEKSTNLFPICKQITYTV